MPSILTLIDSRKDKAASDADRTKVPPSPIFVSRTASSISISPASFFPVIEKRGAKATPIDHLRVYGKPAGAGTDVSLNNTEYAGLGVPVKNSEIVEVEGYVS